MNDPLAAMIQAALNKRAADTNLPRRPDQNNPLKPAYQRPRRGGPTYRDRTANEAVGNVDRQRKKDRKK